MPFFLTAADNMLVQKAQNSRFSESVPFSKILNLVNTEKEVIEIPYKISTVTLKLLHIKPMQIYSYQLINN